MIEDGIIDRISAFRQQRSKALAGRFPGRYRAIVIDTNDPLQMHRIRVRIPELHDKLAQKERYPWAVPSPTMGGRRTGSWTHPIIDDWVWIEFEKDHPYAPVWVGFADPTRRKLYTYPSRYGLTPVPLDASADEVDIPDDVNPDYLPKDFRPMSSGFQDRYGNLDIHSAVGFFPIEHAILPTAQDAQTSPTISSPENDDVQLEPKANDPDSKFTARISKYGSMMLFSDIGYDWKINEDKGEFQGDFNLDESYEISRWKYLQRVIHEDAPSDLDQRKSMMLTRYGHKLELRDVGWNKTRIGEYLDEPRTIGDGPKQMWMKFRTKGGHLIQMSDIGLDTENDEYVKRKILDEVSDQFLDQEDKFGDDARFIRFVSRSGIKLAIDDREADNISSHNPSLANNKIGTGVLIKGRATPGSQTDYQNKSGDPTGYYWQINERPGFNATTWGSPGGMATEISDEKQSIAISSRFPDLPTSWKNLTDNEFLKQSLLDQNVTGQSHHLLIDHGREAIRIKSRAGKGSSPLNPINSAASGIHQGLEIHDGPSDDPWTELIDIDGRGFWLSRKQSLGVWRASNQSDIAVWINDATKEVVIYNNQPSSAVKLFCAGKIDIKAETINLEASEKISLKSPSITMETGGAQHSFGTNGFDCKGDIKANLFPQIRQGQGGPPGGPVSTVAAEDVDDPTKPTVQPSNRLDNI